MPITLHNQIDLGLNAKIASAWKKLFNPRHCFLKNVGEVHLCLDFYACVAKILAAEVAQFGKLFLFRLVV